MQFTVSVLIDLYCQNHFFTSYHQQKETGEITINQESDLVRQRTTTNQTCGNVKKEPS